MFNKRVIFDDRGSLLIGETVVSIDDPVGLSGEPFTVIQGGGFPTGGMGGLYRPEGYNNPRPRALGDLGVRRISRQAMEGFEGAIPRALGNLGADRTTQVAMDVEGVDKL